MILFRKADDLTDFLLKQRNNGLRTGFVPTMGALHQGHISLIRQARESNDLVICSVFINPTQFNDPSDFEKYPVTIENDVDLLQAAGCDILFFPSVDEMYPPGLPVKTYDLGFLETILEGKFRPGHFQGVCRVIDRFLTLIHPDNFYLGQKDYQQCLVVRRLITILGLEQQVSLVITPTLRDPDGLAMSSRNTRLSPDQREQAVNIFRALSSIAAGMNQFPPELLISDAVARLESEGFRVDYVEIASANDLQPYQTTLPEEPLVALAAAFLGDVRLIDNMLLPPRS
ncbi:MAG: pantoate--beta-alanine ligase [Chitinophagaceae bacterium]